MAITDTQACDAICKLLDGQEWDSETTDIIAQLILATGREVRDVSDSDNKGTVLYYNLPAHWACALINDDEGSLSTTELETLKRFLRHEEIENCMCSTVSEEVFFLNNHDASDYGVAACNCLEFSFLTQESNEIQGS